MPFLLFPSDSHAAIAGRVKGSGAGRTDVGRESVQGPPRPEGLREVLQLLLRWRRTAEVEASCQEDVPSPFPGPMSG